MKTRYLALAAVMTVLVGVGASHADHSHLQITPDHPLYDEKTAVEQQVEGLAPNTTEKIKTKLEHAGKRANESRIMADENKTDLVNQTVQAYSDKLQDVNDLGKEVSDLAQQQEIDEVIATATMHHAEVLSAVYEKVPEQAKKGISNALNRSVQGHERAVEAMKARGQSTQGLNISGRIPSDVMEKTGIGKRGSVPGDSGNAGNGAGSGKANDTVPGAAQ